MIAVETSVAFGIDEAALDGLVTQLIMFFGLLMVHLRTLSIKQFLRLETLDRSAAVGMANTPSGQRTALAVRRRTLVPMLDDRSPSVPLFLRLAFVIETMADGAMITSLGLVPSELITIRVGKKGAFLIR